MVWLPVAFIWLPYYSYGYPSNRVEPYQAGESLVYGCNPSIRMQPEQSDATLVVRCNPSSRMIGSVSDCALSMIVNPLVGDTPYDPHILSPQWFNLRWLLYGYPILYLVTLLFICLAQPSAGILQSGWNPSTCGLSNLPISSMFLINKWVVGILDGSYRKRLQNGPGSFP